METFITVTVLWVFSVCLHEFGHALVAYHGGDTTVREKGYLTLNPVHYTHPVYSLLMPVVFLLLGGIGLPGGAVYIQRDLLRSRGWRTAVSLAGPAMNLGVVWALCLPFWFGLIPQSPDSLLAVTFAFLIELQICAILLNLMPIPPLDGFGAIGPWLPAEIEQRMLSWSGIAAWVPLFVLWFVPPVRDSFWGLVLGATKALGVDPWLAIAGYNEYCFWR